MKKKSKRALCILCSLLLIASMSSGAIAAVDFVPDVVDLDAVRNGTQTVFFVGPADGTGRSPHYQGNRDWIDNANINSPETPDIETIRTYGVFVPASELTEEEVLRAPNYCPYCGYNSMRYLGAYYYTTVYATYPSCMNEYVYCRDQDADRCRIDDYECYYCRRIVTEGPVLVFAGRYCPSAG